MKKLMIASAVAAITAGAFAGNCSEDPIAGCALKMTVKFSGKTASEKNLEYKTVQKISGKGVLSISDYVTETFSEIKVGKEKYKDVVFEDGEVTKLTVFGKNLAKALDEQTMKKGKTYSAEADLGVVFEDQTDAMVSVNQVAFGSASVYITKDEKAGPCGETVPGCVPVVSVKKFSGWFTGKFETCLDEIGYSDDCVEFDADEVTALIGGTWSASVKK